MPIWFDNSFSLNWITSARPTEQGIIGLFARFTYKSIMTFGLIQSLILIYYFMKHRIYKKTDSKLLIILTISNFILFLYIPAEKSYLQPAIIFIHLIIIESFNKKILYLLILINFFSWLVSYDFIKIKYKDNSLCAPKHAISASIELKFIDGALKNFYDTRKMISCWVNKDTERGKRIIEGKSTRIK